MCEKVLCDSTPADRIREERKKTFSFSIGGTVCPSIERCTIVVISRIYRTDCSDHMAHHIEPLCSIKNASRAFISHHRAHTGCCGFAMMQSAQDIDIHFVSDFPLFHFCYLLSEFYNTAMVERLYRP